MQKPMRREDQSLFWRRRRRIHHKDHKAANAAHKEHQKFFYKKILRGKNYH